MKKEQYLSQATSHTYVKVVNNVPQDTFQILPNMVVVEHKDSKGNVRLDYFYSVASARKFIRNNWSKLKDVV